MILVTGSIQKYVILCTLLMTRVKACLIQDVATFQYPICAHLTTYNSVVNVIIVHSIII